MLNLFSSLLSLKAGGRNSCASLFSKSGVHSSGGEGDHWGYVKLQSLRYCAVVLPLGFACSHKCGTGPILRPWIWTSRTCLTFFSLRFPLIHMFSLTLTPTALIGRMPGCTEPWWVASVDLTEPRYYWQTEDSQELLSPLALKPFLPRQKSDIFVKIQLCKGGWMLEGLIKSVFEVKSGAKPSMFACSSQNLWTFFLELRKADSWNLTRYPEPLQPPKKEETAKAATAVPRLYESEASWNTAPDEKGT